MKSYEAARIYFSFLSFGAWSAIIIGGLVALMSAGAVSSGGFGGRPSGLQVTLAAIPGAMMAFAGFFGLVFAQIGRATVDTAEYSQQSLDVSRKHLELSKQLLSQGKSEHSSYSRMQQNVENDAGKTVTIKPLEGGSSYAQQPDYPSALQAEKKNSVPSAKEDKLPKQPELVAQRLSAAGLEIPKHEEPMPADGIVSYKGTMIEVQNQTAYVGRRIFTTISSAKAFIDKK